MEWEVGYMVWLMVAMVAAGVVSQRDGGGEA